MSTYLWVCLSIIAAAGVVLWFFRPKKCKECGGTGKIVCHDGTDIYYSDCYKCNGTGWKP